MKYSKFAFGAFVFFLVFGYANHLLLASSKLSKKHTSNNAPVSIRAVEIPTSVAQAAVSAIPARSEATTSVVLIPNSVPVRIYIPSVKIDASVKTVGTTVSGNMAVPAKFSDVGWYKYGAVPGENGNAIIAGHYESGVNKNGFVKGGPFQSLSNVKIGDSVYVVGGNGKTIRFIISQKKIYGKDDTTQDVFGQDNGSKLTLITCNGTWLPDEKTFSNRLVVTALLAEDNMNKTR